MSTASASDTTKTNSTEVQGDSKVHDENIDTVEDSADDDDDDDDETLVVLDPVLGYLCYGLQSGTVTNAKKAAIGHFTSGQIKKGKEKLYDKCKDQYKIGPYYNRRDSTTRSENEANIHDIVTVLQQLDRYEKPPIFAVPSGDLKYIPRSHPEELNIISFVDRLGDLEDTVRDMRIQLDRSTAENMSMKTDMQSMKEGRPSFASVVSSAPRVPSVPHVPSVAVNNASRDVNTEAANNNTTAQLTQSSDHPPSERTSVRGRGRGRGTGQRGRGASQRGGNASSSTHHTEFGSSMSLDRFSTGTGPGTEQGTEPWQIVNSKKKTVTGKLQNCAILGAPEAARDLFIYRVHTQVDTESLEQYIKDKNFDVMDLKCVSREESKYKSFKLTVPVSQFAKLFDENLWPAGIRVRKFVSKRKFPGADDDNE
jgi:hypothetical protein